MKVACLRATFGRRYVLSPVRVICHCLTGLVLLVISAASYAEGTVNPAVSTAAPPMIKYAGAYSNFDTPEAACADIVAHQWDYTSSTTLVYDHVEPYTANHLKCFARDSSQPTLGAGWYANVGIMRSCTGLGWVNYEIACTASTCPDNSKGNMDINPASCTCDTGYLPDAAKTSCVPAAVCPISDLPTITDPDVLAFENNPNISDTERLTPEMKASLKCLTDGATALGCTSTVGSAYRPPAYNQHLREIWNKWDEIKDSEDTACANLKTKIEQHFKKHKLRYPPARNSRHTQGLAVDVTINLPAANIDALAVGCKLFRPLPIRDAVHFQFP